MEIRDNLNRKKVPDRKYLLFGLPVVVAAVAGGVLIWRMGMTRQPETSVYMDTEVTYGSLAVGITESGNVEVGTTTQEFSLDISAYTAAPQPEAAGFSQVVRGGMPDEATRSFWNGSQAGQSSSADSRNLSVEEVYVSVGEEIAGGDPIYRLSEASVERIREELEADVTDAELDLKQIRTQVKQSNLSAAQAYETDTVYGAAAELEYEETIAELTERYTQASGQFQTAQEDLKELVQELYELEDMLAESVHLYDEAAYLVTYIDKEDDPYGYASALQLRTAAEKTKEADEDALRNKQEEIEDKREEITRLQEAFTRAEKELRSGMVSAQARYKIRCLRYQNADELYQVALQLGQQDMEEAEDAYTEAQEKLQEFDSRIQHQDVLSTSSGVVTEIGLSRGDSVGRGVTLLTLRDYDKVRITVTIEDEDIDKITVGDTVNISIAAFPEKLYKGTVEEIGDAQVNTYSSTITYEVTVTVDGDVSGIYTGMTGEVTFVTKETRQVTYVQNRAIQKDGARSFVYMRDEEGNVTERDVVTGFSDGVNVEILEGLSKGDIVLIESRVSGD